MASGIENNSDAWSTTFSIMSLLSPSVFIENRKDMLAITLNTIQKNHHRLKSELVAKEKAIADGETNDQRQQLISLAYIIVFIISGFLILKWIYRANYNARQLGASGMKFTPGSNDNYLYVQKIFHPLCKCVEIFKSFSRLTHIHPSFCS
jgi:hypothetical protein